MVWVAERGELVGLQTLPGARCHSPALSVVFWCGPAINFSLLQTLLIHSVWPYCALGTRTCTNKAVRLWTSGRESGDSRELGEDEAQGLGEGRL